MHFLLTVCTSYLTVTVDWSADESCGDIDVLGLIDVVASKVM